MYMAAAKSANISSWAFTPGTPIPTAVPSHFSRRHYFVFTTSATSPHPDKKFWWMCSYVWGVLYPVVLLVRGHPRLVQLSTNSCILQVPPGADRSGHWLDFAVGAHYLDGDDSVTPNWRLYWLSSQTGRFLLDGVPHTSTTSCEQTAPSTSSTHATLFYSSFRFPDNLVVVY
ncbi:hypothetical protein EB796_005925 [Bugula neritina]|uniref:Uncharacterized protein n=1 Tax=Bugula neritina TaxID=10212 RepID=A0A7J7KD24_BUGNE|nr:hypothetical protein EB796_005925 [Bugula neritina]